MKMCSLDSVKRNWKTWLLVGAVTLVPAVAFAATHAGGGGCSCPICSLMR